VNLLLERDPDLPEGCPIVVENTPTLTNLLGTVDREWRPNGPVRSDYSQIRAGSLLRADGGFLILEARDVLMEPGAWKVLIRTLRNSKLEIVPPEFASPFFASTLKPEPIPISVKVILLGDSGLFHMLDSYDPDFGHLFKVLADFDPVIDREEGPERYAGVLARIVRDEELHHFDRTGVAALVEHGARIASSRGKLTAQFARVADIAREACFLSQRRENGDLVKSEDVWAAIRNTRARGSLPARRFRDLVRQGTLRVQVSGEVIGQINGLAVLSAGPITYGFPARITASIGAGSAGIINIEGQAQLSGSIHTKGFHILGGLLRHLLHTDHPLAFSASLAFEQSYGGIDGDSASCAEICCLLSALTNMPIRQNLAITGSIDQVGHVQAIGGVNEKIEGFYDICCEQGLTGDQGVVVPKANAGDLMLKPELVESARKGEFHIYAVDTVHEALEVLTGVPAGERDKEGRYPPDSLLGKAIEKAEEYWLLSVQSPVYLEDDDEKSTDAEEQKAADASG
jgi:ATP-dependent Lon protease